MACSEEAKKYNDVTDILFNTFGAVLHRDTIYSIVESCCGDLNHAANAIMSITSEDKPETSPVQGTSYYSPCSTNSGRSITKKGRNKNKTTQNTTNFTTAGVETMNMNMHAQTDITPLPKMSYVGASTSKNKTLPKPIDNSFHGFPKTHFNNNCNIWTEQIRRIVTYHNQGIRTLIMMRGAPGSGKSYLARQIQEMTVGTMPKHLHIFCTDDYFTINGYYKYEKMNLQYAHIWNQHRAFEAISKGVSPIIIDNTNIEYWEMQPYAKSGVYNGYLLEVVEPNTQWAKNLHTLTSRNKHKVPPGTIKRMLELLVVPITSINLMANLNLAYSGSMQPPILRNLPKILACSDDTCGTGKIESTLKQNEVENHDAKLAVEESDDTLSTATINVNDNSKAEICEAKIFGNLNEHTKDIIEEERGCNKVILDLEIPELNCAEAVTGDQAIIKSETKEKEIFTGTVETLTTNKDENTNLVLELTDPDGTKDELSEKNWQINNKVEENDVHAIQNISQPSDASTVYTEDVVTLKETSVSHASECIETTVDQENIAKLLEEFQKVENEWDNGEAWEEDINLKKQEPVTAQLNTSLDEKLPKNKRTKESENSLQTLDDENDWRKMYMPMPTITDNNHLSSITPKVVVETKSTETCIQLGDTDVSGTKNGHKILLTLARDININYLPNLSESIPESRKFDKSTMTNEVTIMGGSHRCKNEDRHFIRFRNMFKHLKKEELRDIFDNCCGDVNWAVSIVVDDMPNKQLECITLDEQSEVEEDSDESCDCNAFYGIIPDVTSANVEDEYILNVPCSTTVSAETSNPVKKQKKDSPLSDSSLALKRQIEQNIVISDQHYSEECLKVRKMRRGIYDGDVSTSQNIATGITMQNTNQLDLVHGIDSSSADEENRDVNSPSTFEVADSEYNSDDESPFNEVEKTVNINLGHEFLSQLDALFGRTDMGYSENIETRINMPTSMLNEINALWMESLMCQLEAESKAHQELLKQDEEFARELTLEQLEITKSGKEPEVPNFKEIMDMEFALSLYRKDCEELMQKDRPTDMATKMSAKKLHDLFPEIPQDDLDEILMAHHYDFRTTVGVLLETQGRIDITQDDNGINKFIMAQDLERQERFLAAEKERLLEQCIPELPENINMDTVNEYRSKAKLHLANWNKNFGKAKHMVKRNAAVANYYNSLAGLHLIKSEQANSVAAVSLLHIHARNNTSSVTLDLHFLHVDEAKAALDVFLDTHLQRLRMSYPRYRSYPLLYVITGRGLHSRGGPKIKPAVKVQLRNRGLPYKEMNPGLLSVKIRFKNKMSYQLL